MPTLRIALAQINPTLNDFDGNLALIRDAVAQAGAVDLIVFSELCLSGYYPQDLVEEPQFLARQQAAFDRLLAWSQGVPAALVVGAVTRNDSGVGKPLHNSLLVVQGGAIRLCYHKQLLPTYNIFDERRHFEPGEPHAAVLELQGQRLGFLICEDAWNDEAHEGGRDYGVNPVKALAYAGVDLLVSINASPSHVGKPTQRHALFQRMAQHHSLPLLYVNQVGAHDQVVFDGGSFALDPAHGVVHALPLFEPALQVLEFDGMHFSCAGQPCRTPVEAALSDSEFYYQQTLLGLRDYMRKVGFQSVVVGSSGGIDSALTLALAVDALGPERVHAITMPSRFSSSGSVDDSRRLCTTLGVRLDQHPIGALYDACCQGFADAFGAEPSGLTRENVQARLRGTILMEYSNHFGHLLLSTGNKSEMSVGYATLYGDMNGGLNLIGDLYKTEVFALARYINQRHGSERIPQAIIDKEPSAELAEGQRDTDSLPPYPVLDEILKFHIEGTRLRPDEYQRAHDFVARLHAEGQSALVARVLRLIERSEFKRRQAPPIIRLRNRAFGHGRQMPIAAHHQDRSEDGSGA